jgi:flagellar capping protein FliD
MSTELDVRMSLVEERYDSLEKRMTSVENKIDNLRDDMHNGQKAMIKTIYTTMAVFAGVIISAFGVIVSLIQ